MNLFKDMFNELLPFLSDKETIIFNFISSNIGSICEMNIKELSLKLNITEYSINKFCKKLNIDNFENLISIIKEISETSSVYSNYIFKNSLEKFSNFISKLNEDKISKICKLILKHKSVLILFCNNSKNIAQYLEQNLTYLNITSKLTSSTKQITKQKDIDLVIYISNNIDEKIINSSLKNMSNKIVITISNTIIKEVHDNSSIFIHIDDNKLFKNFNTNCSSIYFMFLDLIISKLIELINYKN